MKVALTVGAFHELGGIERVTVQLARGYRALGHDVTIFATEWDAQLADGFVFERVSAPAAPAWLRTLVLPGATARRLAHHAFDFVHGQGTSTLACDLLTFHSVHAAWLDVSVRESGRWSPRGLAKQLYPFHRATIAMEREQLARHRGPVHACSAATRAELIHYYGVDPDRVSAIPWGIDLGHFRPDAAARRAEREGWGASDRDRVLLLVANEFHRKGLETILEALALLDRTDIRLVVAGRDDPSPFRDRIARLGLGGAVTFLGHREVAPCYQAADLFVIPSTYEPWGLVVGEALACGLPVVASRFAGAEALVRPGQNGLLVDDARDARGLAAAIEQALAPATHAAFVAAARPSVEAFGWTAVCRSLLALGTGSGHGPSGAAARG